MLTRSAIVGALVLIVGLSSAAVADVNFGRGPLRLEWHVDRPGHISGDVYNQWPNGMASIQLLIEGIDPVGRVVVTKYAWVNGEIGPLDHRSFSVTNVPPADHYRVTVVSYQSQERPGCCAR
jgi:hypothetical protein